MTGDLFKLSNGKPLIVLKDLTDLISFFTTYSRQYADFHKLQSKMKQKTKNLVPPCATRWLSFHAAIIAAVENQAVFESLVTGDNRTSFQKHGGTASTCAKISRIILNDEFWSALTTLDRFLEPLAIVSRVAQAEETRCDHIMRSLFVLHQAFSALVTSSDESGLSTYGLSTNNISSAMLVSLENCWSTADQKIFIVAAILDPSLKRALFSNSISATQGASMCKEVFVRIFPNRDLHSLYIDVIHYLGGKWTDFDELNTEMQNEVHKKVTLAFHTG